MGNQVQPIASLNTRMKEWREARKEYFVKMLPYQTGATVLFVLVLYVGTAYLIDSTSQGDILFRLFTTILILMAPLVFLHFMYNPKPTVRDVEMDIQMRKASGLDYRTDEEI